MKTNFTLLLSMIYCMTQSFSIFSQWVNCPNTNSLHGYSLAFKGSDLYAGTQGGVYKSTNNGASFSSSSSGIPSSSQISEIYVFGEYIFARKASYTDQLYRSNDNGTTWQLKNSGLSWSEQAPFYVSNMTHIGSTLYLGTSNGVYKSTDNGDNWSEIAGNNFSSLGLTSKYIRVVKSNNGKLYVGTGEGFFISSDNGVNWSAGAIMTATNDIAFYGNGVYLCSNNGGEIFKSIDDGITFTSVINTLPCNLVRKIIAIGGKVLGAADQGFLVYDINTEEYVYDNNGLTSNSVFSLIINGEDVFTGVQTQGIFKRPLSEFGITNTSSIEKKEYTIMEIYPNPVKDFFIIESEDFENTKAALTNLKGEVIQQTDLLDFKTSISITSLTSGVYFLKLTNVTGTYVSKIVKE
jgi:photosystem II stability/assembly factor-like uncharacterized protein